MSDRDPDRLVKASDDALLRKLLDAGRHELPEGAQLARVMTKLGPILGDGGSTGGTNGKPGSGHGAMKLVLAGAKGSLVIAGVIAGLWGASRLHSGSNPARDATPSAVSTPNVDASPASRGSPTTETPAAAESPAPTAEPVPTPSPRGATASSTAAPRASEAVRAPFDPDSEVKLLQQAQDALGTNPAAAFALADQAARNYPQGILRQEAEILAIDALLRTNHRGAAEERARKFRLAYPTSSHLRRLDTLLAAAPTP
jgi:hypothetical protein